jgi:hypothetical protein
LVKFSDAGSGGGTPSGLVTLSSAEVEAEGGKMPGMVVSLGVGSAMPS